jgi:hypothetical protein
VTDGATVMGDDPDPRTLAVTVYNGNLGLVKDQRPIELQRGVFTLPFKDVAAQIDPTSVAFSALGHPGVRRGEHNEEFPVRAKLLSVQGGAVYQIGDSIALNPPGRVVLPDLKGDLKALPTLVWTLKSDRSGPEPVEVSYLTTGLNWKADYVATLAEDDKTLSLGGWVTLQNSSGTTYPNAKLKLVAGDIHRAPQGPVFVDGRVALREAAVAQDAASFEERTFFEYHLYDLPRPTTIKNNQTKQIRLLEGGGVKTDKVYRLAGAPWYYTQQYGGEKGLKIGVYQEFDNKKRNGLGIALPGGVVRLYKADTDGSLQLIGEDRIDHTPRDERVKLKVGEAFDIVAERRQTEYRKLAPGLYEEEFEVVIRNHKDERIVVEIVEPLPSDWTMLSNTHDYKKMDAFTVQFDVPIASHGEATLKYRVRIKF